MVHKTVTMHIADIIHWKKVKFPGLKKTVGNVNEIYWTRTVLVWYLGNVICQVHSLKLMEISHFMYIFKIKNARHFLAVSEISYIFYTFMIKDR